MKTLFISDIDILFSRPKGSKDKTPRKKRIGLSSVLAGSAVAGGTRGALVAHLKMRKGFNLVLANNEDNFKKAIKSGNPHANIIYPSKAKLKQIYIKKLSGRAGKSALTSAVLSGAGYGAYNLISKHLDKKKTE